MSVATSIFSMDILDIGYPVFRGVTAPILIEVQPGTLVAVSPRRAGFKPSVAIEVQSSDQYPGNVFRRYAIDPKDGSLTEMMEPEDAKEK